MIAIQVRKPKISYRSVNSNGDAAIRRKMKYSEQSVSIIVILIHFRFYAIHTVERGHRDVRYKYSAFAFSSVVLDSNLVRDLLGDSLQLAIVVPVLANLEGKLRDEAFVLLGDLKYVSGDARQTDLPDSDDTVGRDNLRTAEIRLVLDAGQHNGLAQERHA